MIDPPHRYGHDVAAGALLVTVALAATFIGYALLGDSLGLPLFLCFVAPCVALAATGSNKTLQFVVIITATIALTTGLPMLVIGPSNAAPSFIAMLLALTAVAVASTQLIIRLRCPEAIARAVVFLALVAWLTWPVWMAPYWPRPEVAAVLDRLVIVQPLLAANGAYVALGEWVHQAIAYKYLTNLGQDVFYAMPRSAWVSAGAHAVMAIALFAVERRIAKWSGDGSNASGS